MIMKRLPGIVIPFCLAVGLSMFSPPAWAVTVYLSQAGLGDGAPPANLDLSLPSSAIGSTGSFNIWIQTDELVSGATLSLQTVGDSIKFTTSTVPQYAPRWNSTLNGSTSGDGTRIDGLSGFAIPGVSGDGLNPATAASDPGFDSAAGAYHFATVNYEVVGLGSTALWLIPEDDGVFHSGSNCAQFGVGDACMANDVSYPPPTASDPPGYPLNPVRDGAITVSVVPEPATLSLITLALAGFAGFWRRR